MENKYHPAIVVVAYNRPFSLKRLLTSLKAAKKITQAKLIISIDNQEPHNPEVKKIAESFIWPYGEKEIILQPLKLGLRNHILKCGDLSEKYGSVIILEDDLFVSPFFYDYTIQALSFYGDCNSIGGISLYNQPREEVGDKPFRPFDDGSGVYFMQVPSSWGQAWSKNQWINFRNWYNTEPELATLNLPAKIINWPDTSWKKYFFGYLVHIGKFFVFPRISVTTNFNDPGIHLKSKINHDGQSPLIMLDSVYQFRIFEESYCKYDAFFEILPSSIKHINPALKDFSFEVDLYGRREINSVTAPYMLTSKPANRFELCFKRALKPHEVNVMLNLEGKDLFLCKKEDILPFKNKYAKRIADFRYFYYRRLPSIKTIIYNYFCNKFNS